MRHVPDGLLRRMIDDPLVLGPVDRRHLEACETCRARAAAIAADSQAVARLLATPVPPVDSDAALRSLGPVSGPAPLPPGLRAAAAHVQINRTPALRTLAAAAVAAALVVGMVVTGAAANLLTIFEPRQVTTVPVTTGEFQSLQGLPDLSEYGTERITNQPVLQSVADAQAAGDKTGLPVLVPTSLPTSVTGSANFAVVSQGSGSFTFSAARARAAAQRAGQTLPPMPPNIDGSTLYLTVGPGILETYGAQGNEMPTLLIGEARVPKVESSGVTVKQLEDYLLQQPGISQALKDQIRAIGDPSSTLVIPVPVNMANAHPVQVQGVRGVVIGDSSGLGSAVVWVRNGIVYAVVGALTENQVLQVANSLR